MHRFIASLLLLLSVAAVSAETRMRDIFAAAPDSVFPLLTRNNRLDCIDFCENNMPAVVKNRFDDRSELVTLTDRYLLLRPSAHSTVEMRLLTDSLFCMVETYEGPAPDSHVSFFDAEWHPVDLLVRRPPVTDFLDADTDIEVRQALIALPLIKAQLSATDNTLTWQLQTSELTRDQRRKVEGKMHTLTIALSE